MGTKNSQHAIGHEASAIRAQRMPSATSGIIWGQKERQNRSETTPNMRIIPREKKMHQCAYGLKQRALVTAYKQPCATGQIDPEQHGMPGWACCSECLAVWLLVSVAGILQAWYDMWFIPAGSQSNNGYACSRLLRALNNTLTLVPLLLLM